FSGNGVAIEVKTTAADTRQHHVASLAQLEPQGGEEVYVFSMGAKLDPGAPKKLPDFVAEVSELLLTPSGQPDGDLRLQFGECLQLGGYNPERENLYRGALGFMNFH